MPHTPIEELELFQIYESVADWVWDAVGSWSARAQTTIGLQLIRSVDSINANLVEGDGRSTTADSVRFFVIARASARETRLWIERAVKRKLVNEAEGLDAIAKIQTATKMLNHLITYRRSAKFVSEAGVLYDVER